MFDLTIIGYNVKQHLTVMDSFVEKEDFENHIIECEIMGTSDHGTDTDNGTCFYDEGKFGKFITLLKAKCKGIKEGKSYFSWQTLGLYACPMFNTIIPHVNFSNGPVYVPEIDLTGNDIAVDKYKDRLKRRRLTSRVATLW